MGKSPVATVPDYCSARYLRQETPVLTQSQVGLSITFQPLY